MTPPDVQPVTREVLKDLRAIVGDAGIIAGEHELLVYECDAYTLERHLPGVVVLPRTTEEVVAIVKVCARDLDLLILFVGYFSAAI